jgi:hypothetical protein
MSRVPSDMKPGFVANVFVVVVGINYRRVLV